MELCSHCRKDVLSVNDSYVYDDGDESLGIDTFAREHVLMKKISFSTAFLYKKIKLSGSYM